MSAHALPASTVRRSVRAIPLVHVAAAVGAVLLAFEAYLLVKWVTGPDFERVPAGVSEMPGWMKTGIAINQPVVFALAAFCFWRFLIQPWRRERTVTLFGLLCPVLLLTSVYDPLGNFFSNWYGYNSQFLNFGSPLPGGVPGWQGFAEPGQMIAWPIIFIPCTYVFFFIFTVWLGGKCIGAIQRRFPKTPPVALTACFVLIVGLDFLAEGTVMMRLGWYAETGASFNAGEYYQLPYRNLILAALMWTVLSAFVFYRNDKGQTLVERGVERYPATSFKAIGLRFLALLAAVQLILIVFYQLPMALHQKHFPGEWPESIAGKTYFNNGQCGFGTPRECP